METEIPVHHSTSSPSSTLSCRNRGKKVSQSDGGNSRWDSLRVVIVDMELEMKRWVW